MFCVPTSPTAGVAARCPVLVLNVAHVGLFEMLKCSARLLGSETLGVKAYACPIVATIGGLPEIARASVVACAIVAALRKMTVAVRRRNVPSGTQGKNVARFIRPP